MLVSNMMSIDDIQKTEKELLGKGEDRKPILTLLSRRKLYFSYSIISTRTETVLI